MELTNCIYLHEIETALIVLLIWKLWMNKIWNLSKSAIPLFLFFRSESNETFRARTRLAVYIWMVTSSVWPYKTASQTHLKSMISDGSKSVDHSILIVGSKWVYVCVWPQGDKIIFKVTSFYSNDFRFMVDWPKCNQSLVMRLLVKLSLTLLVVGLPCFVWCLVSSARLIFFHPVELILVYSSGALQNPRKARMVRVRCYSLDQPGVQLSEIESNWRELEYGYFYSSKSPFKRIFGKHKKLIFEGIDDLRLVRFRWNWRYISDM